MNRALVLDAGTKFGRNTLFTDPVESRRAAGTWRLPREGESWMLPSGEQRSWTNAVADASGWFEGPAMRGGWALMTIEVPEPRIMVLNASGQTMGYVNGEPRAGDLYQYGYVETPILLQKGTNELLFATGRGRLRVRLRSPRSPMEITSGDRTTPDLLSDERVDTRAAAVLINSTTNWARNLTLEAVWSRWSTRTPVPAIPPLGVFKAGFQVTGREKPEGESTPMELRLLAGNEPMDTQTLALRVRKPWQTFKRTFVSEIDDSVQYFAVQPSSARGDGPRSALFLSFHGASVEGLSQAEAYAPKSWGTVISPTNRRPYAFDWEDWSRLDALEVLERARREFNPDPSRIYLTGHSMGGHGTWNFGATFPDQFAAIGPSAGWISFFSYGGSDPLTNATPVEAILRRSAASSDTLLMATNYLHQGIYIIHGDADDNVPISEANRMREVLGAFHRDVDGHNEPGAGHWWDKSDEPGADCVDWAPMFDFFARHRIPSDSEVRRVRFVTVNPGVSSRSHWAAIESQEKALVPSEIDLLWDPGQRRVTGSTRNVAWMALETEGWGGKLTVQLDGQTLTNLEPSMVPASSSIPFIPGAPREWHRPLWLEKSGGQWRASVRDSAGKKNPRRNGPFKEAFRHHLVLIYGTHGTPKENAWALAKARFDSEAFWYRGNGSLAVVSDDEFTLSAYPDRGVVVYGHREMNSAWSLLLSNSPVQLSRGTVAVGGRTLHREDLGGLFIQPRQDSEIACVAVVAGSGIEGMRLLNRLPYFMAGPGYPDCLVVGREFLQKGNAGIVTAGFFGNDWSVDRGDFEWSKSEP